MGLTRPCLPVGAEVHAWEGEGGWNFGVRLTNWANLPPETKYHSIFIHLTKILSISHTSTSFHYQLIAPWLSLGVYLSSPGICSAMHGDGARRLGSVRTFVVGYIWRPGISRKWGPDTHNYHSSSYINLIHQPHCTTTFARISSTIPFHLVSSL